MGNETYLDYEEEFHHTGGTRKGRSERKYAQRRDRSKYKKSDQGKLESQKAPDDENLKRGRVFSIFGEMIDVFFEGKHYNCTLKGVLKKEKGLKRNLITVGDFVLFLPKEEELSPIVHVEERKSLLSRREHYKGHKEQLIAANIDQVFIVVSLFSPHLRPALIDRYLIAAQRGNIAPIVLINKCDLIATPPALPEADVERELSILEEVTEILDELHIPVVRTSAYDNIGISKVEKLLTDKTSCFAGQSGTGKSSLINAVTGLDLSVGEIVEKTQKGSHTTTTAQLIPLGEETFLIDTPGIRSFGMWDLSPEEIQDYFHEIKERSFSCKYPNCRHAEEPGCAVKEAVENNEISPLRYESYLTLIDKDFLR